MYQGNYLVNCVVVFEGRSMKHRPSCHRQLNSSYSESQTNPTMPNFPTSNCYRNNLTSLSLVHPIVTSETIIIDNDHQQLSSIIIINHVRICYNNEQFCLLLRLHEYFSTEKYNSCSTSNDNTTKQWNPADGRNNTIYFF